MVFRAKRQCLTFIGSVLFLLISLSGIGQSGKVPPLQMITASGKLFRAEQFPMNKPIIIIYFSPECDHCDKFIGSFMAKAKEFENASICMITYLPVESIVQFNKKYNLNKHPNMFVGTEGQSFFIRNYYKVQGLPFLALYTKKGDFVKSYKVDISLDDLISKVKKL